MASTIEYYQKLYSETDSYAGFPLVHSCNSATRSWDDPDYKEIFNLYDYKMDELMHDESPNEIYFLSKETRLRNKGQIFQYTNRDNMDKTTQRKYISIGYATGTNVMVPWDVYVNGAPRYFGTKEEYADLYGFVRCIGQSGYLDGYEDAAVGGYDLDETRFATSPVGIISGNTQVSIFVRARPGNINAPVIVHLIKWGGSGPTKVKLLTRSFFNGKALNIKLLTPKPYDISDHINAKNTGNYERLKWDRTGDITVSVNGIWTEVNVPDLSPWGILVVSK